LEDPEQFLSDHRSFDLIFGGKHVERKRMREVGRVQEKHTCLTLWWNLPEYIPDEIPAWIEESEAGAIGCELFRPIQKKCRLASSRATSDETMPRKETLGDSYGPPVRVSSDEQHRNARSYSP
jgi:hypothetical protein